MLACSITTNVLELPKEQVLYREIGPPLAPIRSLVVSFWALLRSLCGELMWEDVKEGDADMEWISEVLINGTFVGVTDGCMTERRPRQ